MEIKNAVKSELSPGVPRLCMMEGDTLANNKCVKRQRRDYSSAAALSCNMEGVQQQKQPQPDQPTTVTGVKRSSRFRGVIRFNIEFCFFTHACARTHTYICSCLLGKT